MSFWMDIYFMEAGAPAMEQMIMFHDHSMMIIVSVLVFLLCVIINLIKIQVINLNLIENQYIEIVWTMIPMVLLVFIAAPSLRLLYLMEEIYYPDMTLKVMGHQWFWSYEFVELDLDFDSYYMYLEENVDSFRLLETDSYLALPINTIVRFLVSSVDVIHSWTIQSMGVKMDAIPGRLNQFNVWPLKAGLYFGQCSEICGMSHSFMPISLEVMTMDDFVWWVD
uniref:Cytochrome c oxidase subunit 2 n=1 Tax=Phytoseiulus persimilis TaxID=44414 RepID=D5HKV5_PHYPM|nr:cytochrome c oxidase subunit II [Phytoseiulus persimilis]